jgi:hypothetical protein
MEVQQRNASSSLERHQALGKTSLRIVIWDSPKFFGSFFQKRTTSFATGARTASERSRRARKLLICRRRSFVGVTGSLSFHHARSPANTATKIPKPVAPVAKCMKRRAGLGDTCQIVVWPKDISVWMSTTAALAHQKWRFSSKTGAPRRGETANGTPVPVGLIRPGNRPGDTILS